MDDYSFAYNDYGDAVEESLKTAYFEMDPTDCTREDIEYAADCLCFHEQDKELCEVDSDTKALYIEKAEEYINNGTIIFSDYKEMEFEAVPFKLYTQEWDYVREDIYDRESGVGEVDKDDLRCHEDDIWKKMGYKDIGDGLYIDTEVLKEPIAKDDVDGNDTIDNDTDNNIDAKDDVDNNIDAKDDTDNDDINIESDEKDDIDNEE